MRLERGEASIEVHDGYVTCRHYDDAVTFDLEEVRWLQHAALPAAIGVLCSPDPNPKEASDGRSD